MAEITVEFEVICSCGNTLSAEEKITHNPNRAKEVIVEPCEKCLAEAKDKGDTEGYDRGWKEG